LLAVACAHDAPEEVESETVVTVTTATAATGSITAVVHATGTVTIAAGAEQLVTAPEAARIVELPKAVGDNVRKGDVLARFEIPSSPAEASKQRAEVVRAEARLDMAHKALARVQDLFNRGVAAKREVEAAEREIADAEADLETAQASRAAADVGASRSVVRAAFDGVVEKRTHNAGEFVQADAEPILRVVDPQRFEVTAAIPLADAARVVVGAAASVAGPSTGSPRIALRVVSRPLSVAEGTATVPVRLAFAGTPRFPLGAPVQVAIEAEVRNNVVLVPAPAVVHEGDETAVFVVNGDTAQRRPVTVGITDQDQTEIRSGLKAGEIVIVSGQNGLPDGAKVTAAAEHDVPPAVDAGRENKAPESGRQ
jgi:RND family efflux transporter MFP subunit